MGYQAILFDLEGTLVHSDSECIRRLVRQVFGEFGKKISDEDIKRFWFDYKREQFITEFLKISDTGDFWKIFRKLDTAELREKHFKLYGDSDFIAELRKNGFKTAIITGSPPHTIDISLKMFGKENFDFVLRTHPFNEIRPKPDPHGIYECLKILGVEKNQAIFVGNGDEDIICARAAGVFDVLIDRGEHNLIKETPSLRIKSLYELRDFLGL